VPPGSVAAPGSHPGWSLRRTNREFMKQDDPRGFFPTRGEWSRVLTTHYKDAPDQVGVWRIPAAQTDSMMEGYPLCGLFPFGKSAWQSTADDYDRALERRWRRVSATRFVPPGRPARWPVFVEWRREDGRWVVSALGGEEEHEPRVIGRSLDEAAPEIRSPLRLPLPAWQRVAAGEPWYENNEPISVAGRLVKYGLPRVLREGDVVRWGTYRGVGVFVEPAASRRPEVVYIPVDRTGTFQPYQNETDSFCVY